MTQRQSKGALRHMARVWLAFVLCLFPVIVLAQDKLPRIDWAVVFTERADSLETKPLEGGQVVRELALPNGVVVQERQSDEGPEYRTWHTVAGKVSVIGGGPAACHLFYFTFHIVYIEQCPEYRDTEQTREITKRLDRIAKYVGENSVPPIVGDALSRALLQNKTKMRDGLLKPSESICEHLGGEASEHLSGEEMGEVLSEIMSKPQLPIGGNCL